MHIYKNKISQYALILFLCNFFLLYIFYNTFTLIVGDDYQSFAYQVFGGVFSDKPKINHLFTSYVGISHFYNLLFTLFPKINWVAFFDVFFLLIGYLIYQITIIHLAKRFLNNIWWVGICLFSSSFIFIEGFAIISLSRPALILCGLSLYYLLFIAQNKLQKSFYHIIFIIGMMIRPEAGMGMLIFVPMAYLLFGNKITQCLYSIRWIILGVIAFNFYSTYQMKFSSNFLDRIEPEVEYNFMQNNTLPLPPNSSKVDSIKYELAIKGFIFDPQVLTPEYLRSIQYSPSPNQYLNKLQPSLEITFNFIEKYPIFGVLFLLSILIGILKKKWKYIFTVLSLTTFLISTFTALVMVSGIGDRHVQPFLSIYILLLFHLFINTFNSRELHPLVWISISTVLSFAIHSQLIKMKMNVLSLYEKCLNSEQRRKELDTAYNNQLIVGALSSMTEVFDRRISLKNQDSFNNKYMIFEVYQFSMQPPYDNYIKRLVNKKDYNVSDVYEYFCSQNALYITNKRDAQLTEDYLNIVYNMNIAFIPEAFEFSSHSDNHNRVNVYRLVNNR